VRRVGVIRATAIRAAVSPRRALANLASFRRAAWSSFPSISRLWDSARSLHAPKAPSLTPCAVQSVAQQRDRSIVLRARGYTRIVAQFRSAEQEAGRWCRRALRRAARGFHAL